MHARNPYRDKPPDFRELARLYPEFAAHIHKGKLNFDDPDALLSLTRTLLLHDFKLDWVIPRTRLCPALPNRLNYLLWVEDLIAFPVSTPSLSMPPSRQQSSSCSDCAKVLGVDIGTGASAIFPLLGCRMHRTWHFWATEVDKLSVRCAQENIRRNRLGDRIHVRMQNKDAPYAVLSEVQHQMDTEN